MYDTLGVHSPPSQSFHLFLTAARLDVFYSGSVFPFRLLPFLVPTRSIPSLPPSRAIDIPARPPTLCGLAIARPPPRSGLADARPLLRPECMIDSES